MANVLSYPCPHCGAQLDAEKVGAWKPFNCGSCDQTVEPGMFKCPTCQKSLLVVRQKRQLVRYCDSCGFTDVKQGLPEIKTDKPSAPIVISFKKQKSGVTCQQCGVNAPLEASYCPNCGHKFPKKHCGSCQTEMSSDARFCPHCGVKQEHQPA